MRLEMKKSIHAALVFLGLSSMIHADAIMCTGVKYAEIIDSTIQNEKDASQLNLQLTATGNQAVMIFKNATFTFDFIKEIEHPGGFVLDVYKNGASEEIIYSKEQKIVTLKSYSKTKTTIISFRCR
jgi:hypothetical protein